MTAQEHLETYEKALATQQWENIAPLMHPDICVTFQQWHLQRHRRKWKARFAKRLI